jgi:hypothetical protein
MFNPAELVAWQERRKNMGQIMFTREEVMEVFAKPPVTAVNKMMEVFHPEHPDANLGKVIFLTKTMMTFLALTSDQMKARIIADGPVTLDAVDKFFHNKEAYRPSDSIIKVLTPAVLAMNIESRDTRVGECFVELSALLAIMSAKEFHERFVNLAATKVMA